MTDIQKAAELPALVAYDSDSQPPAIEFSGASPGRALVPVPQREDLAARAAQINRHLDLLTKAEGNAGRHRLRAGQHLVEARKHVPPGEWIVWCNANIKRGQRDIQRLMKIAGADDPDAALDQERATNRAAQAASRAKATDVSRIVDELVETPEHVEAIEKQVADVAAVETLATRAHNPAELFGIIVETLDRWSEDDVREFSLMIANYLIDRPDAKPKPVVAEAAGDETAVAQQTEHERKMALADSEVVGDSLAAGGQMSQHSDAARAAASEPPAPTILKKAGKKHGAVIRPDLATRAAEIGLPVSAKAA
jgi:hypothetical protein